MPPIPQPQKIQIQSREQAESIAWRISQQILQMQANLREVEKVIANFAAKPAATSQDKSLQDTVNKIISDSAKGKGASAKKDELVKTTVKAPKTNKK